MAPLDTSWQKHAHLMYCFICDNMRCRILLHLQHNPLHVLKGAVLSRCAKGASWRADSSSLKLLVSSPIRCLGVPILLILLSFPAKKKQTNILALSCFSSFLSVSDLVFQVTLQPGFFFCSWKNSLDNKQHTGLLWSSLFLAHFYKNPYLKNGIWDEKKLYPLMPGQTLCHVALAAHHNWSSKLHKVVDEDRPCPWGEEYMTIG